MCSPGSCKCSLKNAYLNIKFEEEILFGGEFEESGKGSTVLK